MAMGIVILLARSAQLQLMKGNYYQQIADYNRTREKALPSARGLIYDKVYLELGLCLVHSQNSPSVCSNRCFFIVPKRGEV